MTTQNDRRTARLAWIPLFVLGAVAAACGGATTGEKAPGASDAEAPIGFDAGPVGFDGGPIGFDGGPIIVVSGDAGMPIDATAPPFDAGTDAGPSIALDGGAAEDGNVDSAAHAEFPQVPTAGGPVLTAPKFVLVTFAGDTLVSQEEDFVNKVAASTYWNVLSEYGVGKPTVLPSVQSAATLTSPLDDSAIGPFVDSNVGTTLPANDGSVVYILVYPSTISITLGSDPGCTTFGGYHSESGNGNVYVVVPQCPSVVPSWFPSLLDDVTGCLSHELAEAATDPHPYTSQAYGQILDGTLPSEIADAPWAIVFGGGGEVGDMCAQNPDAFFSPTEVGYMVQRLWSNQSAAAGNDPCEPAAAGEVMFDSAPNNLTTVSVPNAGASIGLRMATVGQTATVELDVFSDGPTGPLTIGAYDIGGEEALPNPITELTFSFDKTTAQNGDKVMMTVTLAAQDTTVGFEQGVVTTTDGTTTKYWPFVVAAQ